MIFNVSYNKNVITTGNLQCIINPEKDQMNVKIEFLNGRISREIELNGIRCRKMEREMQKIEEENCS